MHEDSLVPSLSGKSIIIKPGNEASIKNLKMYQQLTMAVGWPYPAHPSVCQGGAPANPAGVGWPCGGSPVLDTA